MFAGWESSYIIYTWFSCWDLCSVRAVFDCHLWLPEGKWHNVRINIMAGMKNRWTFIISREIMCLLINKRIKWFVHRDVKMVQDQNNHLLATINLWYKLWIQSRSHLFARHNMEKHEERNTSPHLQEMWRRVWEIWIRPPVVWMNPARLFHDFNVYIYIYIYIYVYADIYIYIYICICIYI